MRLISRWGELERPEPVVLEFDPHRCHATLLGIVDDDGSVRLPALLHLPDQGSCRITSNGAGRPVLGYDARRAGEGYVRITFPPATSAEPRIEYVWKSGDLSAGWIEKDPRFNGFRRNWLNILQVNPRFRVLANNAASDTCAFCRVCRYRLVSRHWAEDLDALTINPSNARSLYRGMRAMFLRDFDNYDLRRQASRHEPSYLEPTHCCDCRSITSPAAVTLWLAKNYRRLRGWTGRSGYRP